MKQYAPFLLVGTDAEGDSREIWYNTMEQAEAMGNAALKQPMPWQSWEVWGHDPVTEEWRALKVSPEHPAQAPESV